MIYKPLNDFMIESSLKNMAWDGIFINWLKKNYPEIVLENDSNIWQCLGNNDDIISTYKQIKLFLHDEIAGEENLTRLKNLICINCFGINLETTDYLIEEMSKYLDCLSIPEKNMYDTLRMISNTSIYDILISYNEKFENTSLPIISSIRKTLDTNYKRLMANCIELPKVKFDKSAAGITINYLNNENFQFIVGVVSSGKINSANSYKSKSGFKSYLNKLKTNLSNNPGIMSANLINDTSIGLFSEGDVIFGYEYIPIKKILGMNTGDCFKKLDKKLVLDELFFDNPDSLIKHMSSNAIEVIIDMQPEPVLPSYIVAIDEIRENDVEAAKALKVPIYVIDSKCCYSKRLSIEKKMLDELAVIADKTLYLKKLVKLYKFQEQTYLINTGCFSSFKADSISRLDKTYNMLGKTIRDIYNSCIMDDNMSIKTRLDNTEKLIMLNTIITDISLNNNLNSKRIGDVKNFKCFFTEYSSHSEFMNTIISKIEEKFNTKVNTYALMCLASLTCSVQDYNLKICYEEFSRHAREYLDYFKFEYMDLIDEKAFDAVKNFENIRVYKDKTYTILFDDEDLVTIIKNKFNYEICIKNSNTYKLNKVKCSYICKDVNNDEIEVQILKNNDIKIIDKKSIVIHSKDFRKIENKEYVIN